jgi:hypothetical protein
MSHHTSGSEAVRQILDDEPVHTERARETSYRKGFEHGAHRAVEAIRSGYTTDEVNAWLNALQDWRFRRQSGCLPPEPEQR